jgi:hypothetical protein
MVAEVEAFVALPKVAVPPDTVHTPDPGDGLPPVSVTTGLVEHTLDVADAVAVTPVLEFIVTFALAVHAPLVTVHLNTEVPPTVNPVTPEFALLGVVTAPEPETTVQRPVPGEGLLPANVAVVELHMF